MNRCRQLNVREAIEEVADSSTIGLVGGGGGLVEATLLHEEVERRFLETGHPRDLTIYHALGIGDRDRRGLNRFAHEGMVRKVIGGHWVWSPKLQQMARDNVIEAYVLPGGVAMQLLRETAAHRPGLITHVGLGTFIDPRQAGGRMNELAKQDMAELIEIGGKQFLRYFPQKIDLALLKGSVADRDGNICLDEEPANVDTYAMAAAAHNCGGKVIFQVRRIVENGELPARSVRVPSVLVDIVVHDENQQQGYDIVYDPAISGEKFVPENVPSIPEFSIRRVIASRAHEELSDGAVVNYGFGIPDLVAGIVAARSEKNRFFETIEHGTYGGTLLTGSLFGYARNPTCMIDGPSQFDFYSGGGLDIAFLGFGEFDQQGNVNASKFDNLPVGPGGFIDIAQNARKVVFCGTFTTKGAEYETGGGILKICKNGDVGKVVQQVEQITFSGEQAVKRGQVAKYVTERCVFELESDGLVLTEVAPGIDLQSDILDRMAFKPKISPEMSEMSRLHFLESERSEVS